MSISDLENLDEQIKKGQQQGDPLVTLEQGLESLEGNLDRLIADHEANLRQLSAIHAALNSGLDDDLIVAAIRLELGMED